MRNFEHSHEINARTYERKLILFSLLGYAYIAFVLALLISVIGVLIYAIIYRNFSGVLFKYSLPLFVIISYLFKSLWVKIPVPDGLNIDLEENSALRKLLDQVKMHMNSEKIDHVLITNEFNAGILQIRKFGFFGGYKNYLMIGLPLLMCISELELSIILAHEFAHISYTHNKSTKWIYRVSETWFQINEQIHENDNRGSFILRLFFEWYIPRYMVYSLQLKREHEYEADLSCANVMGAKQTANALIRV